MEAALFVVPNSARLLQFDMIFEFYRTMRTKRGGKNKTLYDNPQYGLSKSQSFVVYSMLKISDVTDSGRQ